MSVSEKLTRLEKETENFGFTLGSTHQIMPQIKSECEEISAEISKKIIALK